MFFIVNLLSFVFTEVVAFARIMQCVMTRSHQRTTNPGNVTHYNRRRARISVGVNRPYEIP